MIVDIMKCKRKPPFLITAESGVNFWINNFGDWKEELIPTSDQIITCNDFGTTTNDMSHTIDSKNSISFIFDGFDAFDIDHLTD